MKPIHAISIAKNINDIGRLGDDLKRKDQENSFGIDVEEIYDAKSPLPVSFDITCEQPPFFSELTYTDVMGGIYLKTQNSEVNARIMEQSVIACTNETYPDDSNKYLKDKYELKELPFHAPKQIVFLAGSNLLGIENKETLLPMLYNDPSVSIKPHPNMTQEGLMWLGREYGWDRIIDPDISGYQLLQECETAFSTTNSEIGIISAALKKPHADITSILHFERLAFSSIHRLFQPMNTERNYKTFARIFNSNSSGFIPRWATNIEERVDGFLKLAMEIRNVFRPSFPDVRKWSNQTTNIKHKKGRE